MNPFDKNCGCRSPVKKASDCGCHGRTDISRLRSLLIPPGPAVLRLGPAVGIDKYAPVRSVDSAGPAGRSTELAMRRQELLRVFGASLPAARRDEGVVGGMWQRRRALPIHDPRHVVRGLGTCLEWGDRIDEISYACSDYACFVKAMGKLADDPAAHPDPPRTDGFNAESQANGEHNVAHYAAIMYWGWAVGLGHQAPKDQAEHDAATTEERKLETKAEVYADKASSEAVATLAACLRHHSSWFKLMGFDDDAWLKCRHLPGELWRRFFCKRWG